MKKKYLKKIRAQLVFDLRATTTIKLWQNFKHANLFTADARQGQAHIC